MLNRKDGTNAGRCMSNRLQMYRMRLCIAAEVGGLLRLLFIWFRSVPAGSNRKASPKLSGHYLAGLPPASGFSDAGMTGYPRALAAGAREAPRHECDYRSRLAIGQSVGHSVSQR